MKYKNSYALIYLGGKKNVTGFSDYFHEIEEGQEK